MQSPGNGDRSPEWELGRLHGFLLKGEHLGILPAGGFSLSHYLGEGSSKANHSGLKTRGLTVGSLMGPACSLKRPLRSSSSPSVLQAFGLLKGTGLPGKIETEVHLGSDLMVTKRTFPGLDCSGRGFQTELISDSSQTHVLAPPSTSTPIRLHSGAARLRGEKESHKRALGH